MANTELEFFKDNVEDLPEITERWFKLPNLLKEAISRINPEELIKRRLAGESMEDILGRPKLGNTQTDDFLAVFATEMKGLVSRGNPFDGLNYTSELLNRVHRRFTEHQLVVVRSKIYTERGETLLQLVRRGSYRTLPFGDRQKSFCALSASADFMRSDLDHGEITQGQRIAACFDFAGMNLLTQKAVEKVHGSGILIVEPNTLSQQVKINIPPDPEIRGIQSAIIVRLMPPYSGAK